jgi:hypothetical protein
MGSAGRSEVIGRSSKALVSIGLSVSNALMTTFYTYPEPTPSYLKSDSNSTEPAEPVPVVFLVENAIAIEIIDLVKPHQRIAWLSLSGRRHSRPHAE